MTDKTLNARIVQKHDIEAHWQLAENFIPKLGEVIVYDPDENYSYSRIKVGDGVTLVNSLPFSTPTAENIETALGYVPAEKPKYEQPDWGADGITEVYNGTLLRSDGTESDGYVEWQISPEIAIGEGKNYHVTWLGVEYECEAKTITADGIIATYIGNGALLGTTQTDEPFLIVNVSAAQGTSTIVTNRLADTAETVPVIIEETGTIHKIPAEYIEPISKSTITITVAADGETVTCDTPFETAWAMEPNELAEAVKVVFEDRFGVMTQGATVSVRDINKGAHFLGHSWIRIAVCPPEDTSDELSIPTAIYINWYGMEDSSGFTIDTRELMPYSKEVTSEDVLEYMASEKMIDPVASNGNQLYTNSNGEIYAL